MPLHREATCFRPPLFKPSLSWAFPLLLQLAVPHWVEVHSAEDVVNVGVDAVDACRHHSHIIWLAVGMGVSLLVPVAVFHLFNRAVHSRRWDGTGWTPLTPTSWKNMQLGMHVIHAALTLKMDTHWQRAQRNGARPPTLMPRAGD